MFLWSLGMNGFQRLEPPRSYWKQISLEEKGRRSLTKLAAVLILQGYLDKSRRTNYGTLSQE